MQTERRGSQADNNTSKSHFNLETEVASLLAKYKLRNLQLWKSGLQPSIVGSRKQNLSTADVTPSSFRSASRMMRDSLDCACADLMHNATGAATFNNLCTAKVQK